MDFLLYLESLEPYLPTVFLKKDKNSDHLAIIGVLKILRNSPGYTGSVNNMMLEDKSFPKYLTPWAPHIGTPSIHFVGGSESVKILGVPGIMAVKESFANSGDGRTDKGTN